MKTHTRKLSILAAVVLIVGLSNVLAFAGDQDNLELAKERMHKILKESPYTSKQDQNLSPYDTLHYHEFEVSFDPYEYTKEFTFDLPAGTGRYLFIATSFNGYPPNMWVSKIEGGKETYDSSSNLKNQVALGDDASRVKLKIDYSGRTDLGSSKGYIVVYIFTR